jgi:hypothetical protein
MRDHLPCLQRELKIVGHLCSPFLKRFDLRGIVERVLDLNAIEPIRKFRLGSSAKATSTDAKFGRPRLHLLAKVRDRGSMSFLFKKRVTEWDVPQHTQGRRVWQENL